MSSHTHVPELNVIILHGLSEKFVDTTNILNRKSKTIRMNISAFARTFHNNQIDEILCKSDRCDMFYSLFRAPSKPSTGARVSVSVMLLDISRRKRF